MLKIESLSKDLGEFVLRDVTLSVAKGEYIVIIGPTGAGKTILLETIAGIYNPDQGRIILKGSEITGVPPKDRNICMVYQDYMLFPHLTVAENIGFGLKIRKEASDVINRKVHEAAGFLSIGQLLHRLPDTLSGGEQQRVAIARAVVMEPVLLLLDEPLSALDVQTREKLRDELKRLHAAYHVTVIHVTHNFEEVFSLADRVAVMSGGRIVQIGTPEEVFRKPADEFIARFVGVENIFPGTCRNSGPLSEVTIGDLTLRSETCPLKTDVFVSIRPEDILILRDPAPADEQNQVIGIISNIVDNGQVVKITVDAGSSFVALMTRRTFHEMNPGIGDEVTLRFPPSAVHLF
jgi:ABC-type sugar transport system ATPase subunit